MELFYSSGLRLSELAALDVQDLDLYTESVRVFGKGRKERRVALGRNALCALLYYLHRWRQDTRELEEIGNADEDHIFLAETGRARPSESRQPSAKARPRCVPSTSTSRSLTERRLMGHARLRRKCDSGFPRARRSSIAVIMPQARTHQ